MARTEPVVTISEPQLSDQDEFLAAVAASRKLHHPWVSAPSSAEDFVCYVNKSQQSNNFGYLVRAEDGGIAGVINISEVVFGVFQSGYLGYYAMANYQGQGLIRAGMNLVIRQAFLHLGLHRLEANIQPGNKASKKLVKKLGFKREGFSPRYLYINGDWRDHERWALLADSFR